MCQSLPTSEMDETASSPRFSLPGAWYDVSSRLGAARAVATCIFDAMPYGDRAKPIYDELNRIGDLATAVIDLIDLCKRDNDRVEEQLLATARKGA